MERAVGHAQVMARPDHTDFGGRRARELRREMTISEARLWKFIKNKATGARFRRQVPIGRWITDFASFDPPIVIEVDGPSHEWKEERGRTANLQARGFTVVRYENKEIAQEVDLVVDGIKALVGRLKESPRH